MYGCCNIVPGIGLHSAPDGWQKKRGQKCYESIVSRLYSREMAIENELQREGLRRLDEAAAMRALSHPVRIALLEAFVLHDELTATQASEIIQESPTTCSFHLRQLAKYGFVEEADRGKGRRRPWRVVQKGFIIEPEGLDDEAGVAASALMQMYMRHAFGRFEAYRASEHAFPVEWRRASAVVQQILFVTPTELEEINQLVNEMLDRYRERLIDPQNRPDGSLPVEALYLSYPVDFDELPGEVGNKEGEMR